MSCPVCGSIENLQEHPIVQSELIRRLDSNWTQIKPALRELEEHGLINVKRFGARPFYLISANLNHKLVKALKAFYFQEE